MDTFNYLTISVSPDTSALDLFVAGTDEVYVIIPVERGWRFSRVTRRGSVSVTVADGRILPGARILDALRIAAACPGGGNELFSALASAEMPASPLRAPAWLLPSDSQLTSAAGTACRSFLSGRDIERMLSFPAQAATAPFARTVLAPATAALRPAAEDDPSICRITAPVERRYVVIFPDGVRPSAKDVAYGDDLTLTYYAEGKTDATHLLVAGKPSPFVEYDGAAIRVRPLSALGIRLDPIPEPRREPEAPAPKSAPAPAAPAIPGQRTVSLAIRFADDRVVRASLAVDSDSSEYKLLRSGMFHGHRARRLAVRSHGDESYLIDLRDCAAAEPQPLAAAQPEPQQPADRRRRRRANPWLYMVLIFLALALGIVGVSYLPGLFEHIDTYDTAPADTAAATMAPLTAPLPADTVVPADTAAAPAEAAEEPAAEPVAAVAAVSAEPDYEYLNRAAVWQRDSLASAEAIALFDLFSTGNLAEIPAHPFFASGRCTNDRVMKTVTLIWQAKGSSTHTGNERALQRLKGLSAIDFNALFNQLAGLRSEKPNTRPLPGH